MVSVLHIPSPFFLFVSRTIRPLYFLSYERTPVQYNRHHFLLSENSNAIWPSSLFCHQSTPLHFDRHPFFVTKKLKTNLTVIFSLLWENFNVIRPSSLLFLLSANYNAIRPSSFLSYERTPVQYNRHPFFVIRKLLCNPIITPT